MHKASVAIMFKARWKSLPRCLAEYVLEEMFIILNLNGWVKLNQEKTISKPHTQTQISSVIKLCLDSKVFSYYLCPLVL